MIIPLYDLVNNLESYILNLDVSSKIKNHCSLYKVISEIRNILNDIEDGKVILKKVDLNSFYIQIIYQDGICYSDKLKKNIIAIKEINLKVSIDEFIENPCLYFDKYTSKAYWNSNSYWTHTLDSNHESKVYNKNGVLIEKEYKEINPCSYNFGYRDSTRVSYENLLSRIIKTPLSTKIEQSENNYNKMMLLHRNKFDVAEYYCKNNEYEYGAVIPVNIEQGIANINIKDETYFKGYIIPKHANTSVKLKQRIMYR